MLLFLYLILISNNKNLDKSPSNISNGNNNDYIAIETESSEKFTATEISNNSQNTQDTGSKDDEDNLFFFDILGKNKDKGIKFQYKHTDFEEGDMVTSYLEHQIEKKLKIKYPGGIPKNLSPNSKENLNNKKLYVLPKNIKELINRSYRREK